MRPVLCRCTPVLSACCGFVLLLGLAACGGSSTAPPQMVDSGSWYRTGYRWPHDGDPYESEHFIVCSDAASLDARVQVATIGEELLASLRQDFDIGSDTLFRFPAGQSKIHIYAYKDHYEPDWGGRAYYGGVMIYSLDNPRRASAGNTQLQVYRGVVKHELMHAIQFLLQGSDDPNLADAWLTEGIAEYVSGGTAGGSIHDLARLDSLIDKYGALNPIAMHQYHYPDVELIAYNYYYPMFELAVTYLVDPSGAGGAKSSIRDIFLDVGKGIPFPTAFEDRLGIGLAEYEDQFFDRIRAFLR